MQTIKTLAQRDLESLWHPFTQMQGFTPIPIMKALGAYIYDEKGIAYLDAVSSWWVNLHGHGHPHIVEKIKNQMDNLVHVMFNDFTHLGAIELAERLLKIVTGKLSRVFYSDNGSTSVEAALKIAFQYWNNIDSATKKRTVISFKGGYHGDTFGAMSAAGKHVFNRPFWSHLFEIKVIDPPVKGKEEESLLQLIELLKSDDIACFIFEPIVMGAGGMIIYSPEMLSALIKLCKQSSILTIADEVMTGFGRTGPHFACDYLTETPDIICLSKGLTGGFLPLGATLCTEEVFKGFLSNDRSKAFLHGHSYTANPLACAAALGSLDLLELDFCTQQRNFIAQQHKQFCLQWNNHPKLRRCESIGTLLVIEFHTTEASYFNPINKKITDIFLSRQIVVRPLGPVLYIMSPYCINKEELKTIYQTIIFILESSL